MDSFELLTLFVIPTFVLWCCYLVMRKHPKGKRLFMIITLCWVIFNIIKVIVLRFVYRIDEHLGTALLWFLSIYLELLIFLIFAIVYRKGRS